MSIPAVAAAVSATPAAPPSPGGTDLARREPALLVSALTWVPLDDRWAAASVSRLWRRAAPAAQGPAVTAAADLESLLVFGVVRRRGHPPPKPRPSFMGQRPDVVSKWAARVLGTLALCPALRRISLSGIDWGRYGFPNDDPGTVMMAGGKLCRPGGLLDGLLQGASGTLEELEIPCFPMTQVGCAECFRRAQPRALRRLSLRGCINADLSAVLGECPALTDIDARGLPQEELLAALGAAAAAGMPPLRRVAAGWFSEFTGDPGGFATPYSNGGVGALVGQLLPRMRSVEGLALPGWTALTNAALLPAVPSLQPGALLILDLTCTHVSDQAVAPILEASPRLQSANLRATLVSDASLRAAGARCPELRALNVSCTRVGDAGVRAVTAGCPHLHTLDLCYPAAVAPESVLAACRRYGAGLRMLGVGGICISDGDLQEIVSCCPNISHLGIGGCEGLTAAAFRILRDGLPGLRKLLAHALPAGAVTATGVMELLRSNPGLKALDLYNVSTCPELSSEQLEQLQRQYPYNWLEDWEGAQL
eukprot:TRINITY_DN13657_c0_g1_i1.p1 TRINITY_DN13657_c0_g1~~TRINITY_DN13657_c0_g1_i1.p1  ORF type:complete len:537 (+),score=104.43 TRINITY_DN13657_c0_g1_i1:89-1699(+)